MRAGRQYDSTVRRERARRNREEVLARARELLLARGFAGTTIAAIAAAAGVSAEMLYATWGGKAGIVEALLRSALRGTEDGPPLERSDAVAAIQDEASPRRALALYGELLARIQPKLAPMLRLLREGAAANERLAAILEASAQDRLQAMERFAGHLAGRGALAPGITVEHARDVLWTLNSADLYELLVEQRGWSPAAYGEWVAATMAAALLGEAGSGS